MRSFEMGGGRGGPSPSFLQFTFACAGQRKDCTMAVLLSHPATSEAGRTLAVLRTLFGRSFSSNFSVALWDGTFLPAAGNEQFTFVVAKPFGLRAALLPPIDLNPGRAFVENWIDIRGDVEAAVDALTAAIGALSKRQMARVLTELLRLPKPPSAAAMPQAQLSGRPHTPRRDAEAVGFHYDQPLNFYRSFLDEELVYSCAYFADGVQSLGDAQRAKIDYTLRKIRLQPGETLLDIGCGWGALVMRAAQKFGAKAVGITLSREQHAQGLRRIAEAGLENRVSIEYRDYRDLGERRFDKIVSLGMVEHVGRERLAEYFAAAFRALQPGGLFLNHGIAQLNDERGYRVSGFIGRYVFPDGDLLPITVMNRAAEGAGFELRDVENLREHYAHTLRAWSRNLEAHHAAAIAATSERTYRIWRLYMAGSAQGFARGRMALYQTLLAKRDAAGKAHLPGTRDDLYAPAPHAQD
jgi:cyclopropane-fatty-acyl-phospholipid synthase